MTVRHEKSCSQGYEVENWSKTYTGFTEMTGHSCFAEIQNLSSDTSLISFSKFDRNVVHSVLSLLAD